MLERVWVLRVCRRTMPRTPESSTTKIPLGPKLRWAKSRDSIAESLARVIAAIRIASVRWRSYLPPKQRN